MTEQEIRDLCTLNYVMDDGTNVSVTLCEFEKLSGKQHGGRNMSVSIDVDGVNRLTVDDHFSTIADFGIGAHSLKAVMICLGQHLSSWASWQQFQMFLGENDLPPRVETGDPMPVYQSNLAARHIEQLDDAQAWWWVTDPEIDDRITTKGAAIGGYLCQVADEAWEEWTTQNREAIDKLNDSDRERKLIQTLTNPRLH